MLVYILTGLVACLSLRNYEAISNETLSNKKNYQKIFYKYSAILVCVLIFGLRDSDVGTDTKNYLDIFNWLGNKLNWDSMIYEKGFCFLSILTNKIFGTFTALLLISGFIIYWNIVTAFCEISKSPSISMLCYFGFGSFAQSCNLLRQYLALSFCLIALCYLIKRKNIMMYFLCVFIGFLFHKSAIVYLLVLPIKYIRFNLRNTIIIVFGTLATIFLLPNIIKLFDIILGTGYAGYLIIQSNTCSITNIGTLVILVFANFLIMRFHKLIEKNTNDIKAYELFANLFLIFSCLVSISIFSAELIDRIAIYFLPSAFFLIPAILNVFKRYKSKIYVCFLFIIFLVLVFFLLVVRGSYEVIPYSFIDFS